MRKLSALLFLLVLLGQAHAANRCTLPSGKVEYSDKPCENEADSRVVNTAPNSIDTSHSDALNKEAVAREECDAAKLSAKYNRTKQYQNAMRKACALPAPEPRQRTRTTCSGTSQAIGGNLAATSQTCTTR
jgi:hypothetical protein